MILRGDALAMLQTLPSDSVQCIVTSPPYWALRRYDIPDIVFDGDPACDHEWGVEAVRTRGGAAQNKGLDNGAAYREARDTVAQTQALGSTCSCCGAWRGQLGQEPTPDLFIRHLVEIFREARRVMRADGTCWINMGDCYNQGANGAAGGVDQEARRFGVQPNQRGIANLKPKDLVGIPWMLAFALRADGWYLRSEIVWAKGLSFCPSYAGSVMPESVTDRPTRSHEQVFLLTKSERYFYDYEAVKEQGVYPAGTRAAKGSGTREGNRRGSPKQDGTGSRRTAGFNERYFKPDDDGYATYDGKRNMRTVWAIGVEPFSDWTQTVRQVRVPLDEIDGDTTRIVSPDCPVHVDRAGLVSTASCGERAAGRVTRNGHNGNGRASLLPLDSVPIGRSRVPDSPAQSSDSQDQPCAHAATARSNQTSRTAHAPATTRPCTPSAQSLGRTDGTPMSPANDDSAVRTHESSTAEDSGVGVLATTADETPLHTDGKCSCEYYRTVTDKTSHFATFPPALVDPCLRAGTSQRGACGNCGAPHRRVVEYEPLPDDVKAQFEAARTRTGEDHGRDDGFTTHKPNYTRKRLGETWTPTCGCGRPDVQPCVVLDPFCGSGTVGMVAEAMQLRFIGIDLGYHEMSERRIAAVAPLFAAAEAP